MYIDNACDGYIHHDRLDQFTGRTLEDGTKVFERDKIICNEWTIRVIKITTDGVHADCPLTNSREQLTTVLSDPSKKGKVRVVGIEGVKEATGER
jgi:hypothetical protein